MCSYNDRLRNILPILHILIIVNFLHFTAANECILPECNMQGQRLIESMNMSIDPCEDFVEFACGKQFENFDKMKIKNEPNLLIPTTYRLNLWWMRKLLQRKLNEPEQTVEPRAIKLAKIFWKNCINVIHENALMNVQTLLKRLGGWPLITKSWNSQLFTWDKFSKCARRLGFLPRMFIHIGVNVDKIKTTWHPNDTINLTIERPMYNNPSITGDNIVYDIGYYSIAEFLSNDINPKISETDDALHFAQTLRQLKCSINEQQTKVMSIRQLKETFPIIDWFDYIRAMMRLRQAKYLTDYNCIIVDVCYLSAFSRLIPNIDKKIQADYAFMAIIDDLFSLTRPQLALAFANNREDINEICFDTTATIFRDALDVIIEQIPESPDLKQKISELQINILKQAYNLFYNIPWMDVETKRRVYKKLFSISYQNPFPHDTLNNNFFFRLDFQSDTSIAVIFRDINILLIDNYYLQAGRSKIQYGIYHKNDRVMGAVFQQYKSPNVAIVKPNIFNNIIHMPARAVLHRQLSINHELSFVNYASIGVQLGTSLSYHMYQKGSHIDADRKWHTSSWWSKRTQDQFINRKSCHDIGPMKPIADASMIFGLIGGVEIAYMSMFGNCSLTTCTTTLKGLNFNTRQLFWLAFVISDCDQNLKQRYNTILSHNKNFTYDFQCKDTSKMNIHEKCKMWAN